MLYQLSYTHHVHRAGRDDRVRVYRQTRELVATAYRSPWTVAAILAAVALSGPGGGTKTAAR